MKHTANIKSLVLLSFGIFTIGSVQGQSYSDTIQQFRRNYRDDFLKEERSPLKASDTSFLRFFPPDKKYCVMASIRRTPEAQPFSMPTHSGKTKRFRKYGILSFSIGGMPLQLEIYQSADPAQAAALKDYLFLPFKDLTNYETTYGGGRYLDLNLQDIDGDKLVLDFNKCYNPYCAYAEGYNCPIPPMVNNLAIAIKAGEKNFGRSHSE